MAERRQKIRGTTLQLDQELGLAGLLAVDTEKNNLRLYDGMTLGGHMILNADEVENLYAIPPRLASSGVALLGDTKSANEAVDNGWYYTDATTLDQPEAAAGAIHVATAGAAVTQTWIHSANGNTHRRVRSAAGVWSAWNRVIDKNYFDPAVAVVADSAKLGGQLPAYYTDITARLGFTPANKAGDTFTGLVNFNAGAAVTGTFNVSGAMSGGGALEIDGQIHADGRISSSTDMVSQGHVYAGNGAIAYASNGDILGGIWGTNLSSWLAANKLNKTGGTVTGALEVIYADATIYLQGGNRRWCWQAYDNGSNPRFRLVDVTLNAEAFTVGNDGTLWCRQMGDLYSHIENRASAYGAYHAILWGNLRVSMANMAVGDLGALVFGSVVPENVSVTYGSLHAGSDIRPTSLSVATQTSLTTATGASSLNGAATLGGTWRSLGQGESGGSRASVTLFVRVA